MAEGQILFRLGYEQFMGNWGQNILSFLQEEFDTRNNPLSRSLLFSEETEGTYWLLVDFENKKSYEIKKESDTTVGISEGPDIEKRFDFLGGDAGTILPCLRDGKCTHTGIIDALRRLNFAEFNLEYLKRSDLSNQKLSFESVYPELQDTYEMLRDILTSSRESLIGLPSNDVQHLKNYIIQFYDMTLEIGNFEVESKDITEDHNKVKQKISQFRETVKKSLLQTVTYLSSRRVEQLEDNVKTALTAAEDRVNTVISEEVDKLQKIGEEIKEQQAEVLQKSEEKLKEIEQTHLEYQNQLTEKPISQYKAIFTDQAQQHRKTASRWLLATSGLSVVFVVLFVWLLSDVVPADDNTPVILSVLVTKGFFLSLVFFLLNRTIKNFTAEKHLQVINTHRQNALETFDTFVAAAEGNRETRDQVLLAATKAIFEANQSGYLSSKTSSSDTAGPVQQIIKEVMPSKSSTGSD